METSENINELATALVEFHKGMGPLELDAKVKVTTKKGGEYQFKYATFENIVESCRKGLTDNGLVISQLVGEGGLVTTILMHKSGQYLKDSLRITTEESTPQSIGSAISYAKRYSYGAVLGIVTEQDDDANIAEGNTFKTNGAKDKLPEKPWLNEGTEEWKNAVSYLRGEYEKDGVTNPTIAGLEKRYRISKVNKDKLMTQSL
jgi:hypothetical protein